MLAQRAQNDLALDLSGTEGDALATKIGKGGHPRLGADRHFEGGMIQGIAPQRHGDGLHRNADPRGVDGRHVRRQPNVQRSGVERLGHRRAAGDAEPRDPERQGLVPAIMLHDSLGRRVADGQAGSGRNQLRERGIERQGAGGGTLPRMRMAGRRNDECDGRRQDDSRDRDPDDLHPGHCAILPFSRRR